jgi:hypothetical protein
MRILSGAVVVFTAVSAVGCERSTFVQPEHQDATVAFSRNSAAAAVAPPGKPEIDPTYANGTVVYMIGPHLIVNARATMPNAYAHAEELYLVTYPQASLPLPSGYQPQCNPCFHPGLPAPFVFHDHVITGAPGMAYVASPTFKPITSASALDAAEAAGNVFLPINAGGSNVYEVDTGNLLICPTVSNHA